MPGSEREGRCHLYRLVRNQSQTPALLDRTQDQDALLHRERLAHAQAWTTAEGKICKARQVLGEPIAPAFGTEAHWIIKPTRIALDDVRHNVDTGSCWQRIPIDVARPDAL